TPRARGGSSASGGARSASRATTGTSSSRTAVSTACTTICPTIRGTWTESTTEEVSMFQVNWSQLFVPSGSLIELVIRGSVVYLLALTFMRILRRGSGITRADLLFITFIADASQNGMAGSYQSITEAGVLVGTIFTWNYGLDWLSYRVEAVHRLLEPPPILVVHHGKPILRALRSELISIEDLMEQLREQGVDDMGKVKRCWVEADGKLSVIR